MKIKEIRAGVKISQNYNSYSINLVADIEDGENSEEIGENLIEKAEKIIFDKINSNKKTNFNDESPEEIEVGAAWLSKKSQNVLSVQYSKDRKWEDVEIKNLEIIPEGYKQKTEEGILIFRKIPKTKRLNSKMPLFRIYKE